MLIQNELYLIINEIKNDMIEKILMTRLSVHSAVKNVISYNQQIYSNILINKIGPLFEYRFSYLNI